MDNIEYYYRMYLSHFDDENEEEPKKPHYGNTRLPFGLCKSEGIDTQGMTPKEAWEALESGTGMSHDAVLKTLADKKKAQGKSKEKVKLSKEDKDKLKTPKSGVSKVAQLKNQYFDAVKRQAELKKAYWKYKNADGERFVEASAFWGYNKKDFYDHMHELKAKEAELKATAKTDEDWAKVKEISKEIKDGYAFEKKALEWQEYNEKIPNLREELLSSASGDEKIGIMADMYKDAKDTGDYDSAKYIKSRIKSESPEYYAKNISTMLGLGDKISGITERKVNKLKQPETSEQAIKALAGVDGTPGSCASVALAYIGRRAGLNVLDFRGGASRKLFSMKSKLWTDDMGWSNGKTSSSSDNAIAIMKEHCEVGKEYYLSCAQHASIVRKNESGQFEFLELQANDEFSGWHSLGSTDSEIKSSIKFRFGSEKSYNNTVRLVDTSWIAANENFIGALQKINTASDKQKKY